MRSGQVSAGDSMTVASSLAICARLRSRVEIALPVAGLPCFFLMPGSDIVLLSSFWIAMFYQFNVISR